MAAMKAETGSTGRKAPAAPAVERRVVRQAAVVASDTGNSNRLLREAAWSRMFGRVESKNPFSR